MKDVAMFVLSSGERIIAGITSETETTLELEKPATIRPIKNEGGNMEIAFQPYVLGSSFESNLTVYKNQIIAKTTADVQIETYYRSSVSGIAMPSQKQVLLG